MNKADDAGVYKISDELALIQTVDFFTPIVDDPYAFGQIAVANALSDVYAMGGIPKTAMNLAAFPVGSMELSSLRRIIEGGLDKLKEAEVSLVGGHSVEDAELKFGISVTGFVHPDRCWTNNGLKAGDRLILTKAIGSGIVNTVIKAGMASPELIDRVTRMMAELNRKASEAAMPFSVHACTDITGFGLLGHLAEMLSEGDCGLRLNYASVPVLPEALEFASMGLVPAGAAKNKAHRLCMVDFSEGIGPVEQDILFDPQTSGGLLLAVPEAEAGEVLSALRSGGCPDSSIIGEVIPEPAGRIIVES
jgi:selenide,water dikinase